MTYIWRSGLPLVVRKSRFLGKITEVNSLLQARDVLLSLKKQDLNATHYISVSRIKVGQSSYLEEASDNGEPPAASRLMTIVKRHNIYNVLLVVLRWYGGKPLGPARFRAIDEAAESAIKEYLSSKP